MYCAYAVACFAFFGISWANPVPKCVPPEKGFSYTAPCRKYAGKTKMTISKITATQGTPPMSIDQRGGLDLTQPLTLAFNLTYDGRPIKSHRMDQKLKKYKPDETGKCRWQEVDTAGATDDIDACQMIKNVDCHYKVKPSYVTAVIDWAELFGDAVSAMEPGAYYGFDVVERDGSEIINCYWMQTKIVKTS